MTEVSFFAELEPATQWLVACFSMTCDLNGFTHISSLGSLQSTFLSDFHLCLYDFFCNSVPCRGCSTMYGVNPNFTKYRHLLVSLFA